MAASAGTNPGSTTDAEGVGVGDDDASGEGEAPVTVGAGLTADAEVHPARMTAMAITPQAWAIRREWVPPPMHIGRGRRLRACTSASFPKSCYHTLKAYVKRSQRRREFDSSRAWRLASPAARGSRAVVDRVGRGRGAVTRLSLGAGAGPQGRLVGAAARRRPSSRSPGRRAVSRPGAIPGEPGSDRAAAELARGSPDAAS